MRNSSEKNCGENKNIHFMLNIVFRKSCRYEVMSKNTVQPDMAEIVMRRTALHGGNLRLQTHTQNMQYLMLVHCSNGCVKAPQSYIIGTLPVLHILRIIEREIIRMYIGVHVKCPLLLSYFNKIGIFSADFRKILK
jgi:hypothetical protein